MMVPPHWKLLPEKDDEVVTGVLSSERPTWTGDERSCRTDAANFMAPSIFSCPAPCSKAPKPFKFCAEYSIKALTIFGVSFGLSWSIKAAVPAATGVATEVPLIRIIL